MEPGVEPGTPPTGPATEPISIKPISISIPIQTDSNVPGIDSTDTDADLAVDPGVEPGTAPTRPATISIPATGPISIPIPTYRTPATRDDISYVFSFESSYAFSPESSKAETQVETRLQNFQPQPPSQAPNMMFSNTQFSQMMALISSNLHLPAPASQSESAETPI